jgi:putative ABC transport system permease protein
MTDTRDAPTLRAVRRLFRLLVGVSVPRLREHRLRTSLTIVGIALGVAVLIAVALINRSILKSVATTIGDVAGKADLQMSAASSGFDETLSERVRAVPGVYKAAVILEQTVTIRDPRAGGERLLLLGVDFLNAEDDYFRSYGSAEMEAIERDAFAFLNSPYHLVLSRSVARRLGYRLHDEVALQTPFGKHDFEIWGFIGDEGVGRAFGGAVAVMDYGAMQIAFGRGKNIDRIDIAVTPGADVAAVASAIKAALGGTFSVDRPERRNERVSYMLATLRNGLTLASAVALIVGMFLIYNTMSISVVQRRREIGTIRALGAMRNDVLLLFILEAVLLGIVGAVLGVVAGIGLARVMLRGVERTVSDMFVPLSASELQVSRPLLFGAVSASVIVTVLAAAIPARQAARQSPIETLRTGAVVRMDRIGRPPMKSDIAALALLAAAWIALYLPPFHGLSGLGSCVALTIAAALLSPRVVQLTYSITRFLMREHARVEMRIAADNLPRNIVRTSATVSALMVSVSMATSFAVFVGSFETSTLDWVDQTLPADLWISSASRLAGGGTGLPMASDLSGRFAAVSGVATVERVRMADIEYRGVPVKVVAAELPAASPRIRMLMLEGEETGALKELRAGAVVVAENFSRRFGVHRGDRVALPVKGGTRWFDVAGVIVDYTSDTGMIMMDRRTYVDGWGDDRVDTYKLYLEKGADSGAVRRAINREYADQYDLFVLTNREFRDEVVAMLDQAFAVVHLLEAVAIVVSVLGVLNSLLANVLDRIREIGVLRAVGMRRDQVVTMVVFEGCLVGAAGIVGGVVLGLSIGHVLLGYVNVEQTGWYLPYRPSWSTVAEIAALIGAGSALAGWYPARHAARLVIAEALGYE